MDYEKRESWPGDEPTGKTRKFDVTITVRGTLVLDESVIAQGQIPESEGGLLPRREDRSERNRRTHRVGDAPSSCLA